MKTKKQKGFTLVELVIVIAVIAILAAVLIPTFSNLIQKANQSADIQAVRQMNTHLATYVDGSVTNVADAVSALDEENIDLDDYKPLQKNHYFYFVLDKNNTPMVIYTDEKDKIVFPTNTNIATDAQWMSLSGDVPTDSNYEINDGKVTIDSGAQLADLINSVRTGNSKNVSSITLSNDVDLKGSSESFGEVSESLTLDGNGKKISGLRFDSNTNEGIFQEQNKNYGFGLFNNVESGTVKVCNLTIENVVSQCTDGNAFGHSGILVGSVQTNANVEIEDVTIKNSSVIGADKAASVIGSVYGEATFKNVTIENVEVLGLGWVAKVVGYAESGSKIMIDETNGITCNNVSLGINEEQWRSVWYETDYNWYKDVKGINISDIDTYSEFTGSSSDTYIPYHGSITTQEGSQNADIKNKFSFEGMITENYFWYCNRIESSKEHNSKAVIYPQSMSKTLA